MNDFKDKDSEAEEIVKEAKVKWISKKKIFIELKEWYKIDSDKLLQYAVQFD